MKGGEERVGEGGEWRERVERVEPTFGRVENRKRVERVELTVEGWS